MASSQGTVDFIVEQIAAVGTVSARKMFGEYGIYCDGRMVALVCDDRLFVKPTPDGRAYLGACDEARRIRARSRISSSPAIAGTIANGSRH
jgi:TfoX/Sxy family transcriptional regulator of competence genes